MRIWRRISFSLCFKTEHWTSVEQDQKDPFPADTAAAGPRRAAQTPPAPRRSPARLPRRGAARPATPTPMWCGAPGPHPRVSPRPQFRWPGQSGEILHYHIIILLYFFDSKRRRRLHRRAKPLRDSPHGDRLGCTGRPAPLSPLLPLSVLSFSRLVVRPILLLSSPPPRLLALSERPGRQARGPRLGSALCISSPWNRECGHASHRQARWPPPGAHSPRLPLRGRSVCGPGADDPKPCRPERAEKANPPKDIETKRQRNPVCAVSRS